MNESRAAIRYAKAVLDLAVENKSAQAVEDDMRSIVSTIAENEDLQAMLGSPVIKGKAKQEVLAEIFSDANQITEGVIAMLVANKRIGLLHEVALKYIVLNEKLKGEGVAIVTSAVPLTPELEADILKKVQTITGNKVTIKNIVDESILGGFVLRVGDLQFDASISNKLNNIKREFSNIV
jgi:F-type H+-transporting ATPase subunit delta